MNTAQFRQWLADGKTERVLDELLRLTSAADPDLHHEATLLSARFEHLARQKRLGTLEFEDESREQAQINHSLLEIIKRLEETGSAPAFPTWAKRLAVIIVAVGILAGIAYTSGWFEKQPEPAPAVQTSKTDTAAAKPAAEPPAPVQTPPAETKPKPEVRKTIPRVTAKPKLEVRKQEPAPRETPKPKTNTSSPEIPASTGGLLALPTEGEAVTIKCKTTKNRLNVHYRAGEALRLYFMVNQPCHVRVIYQLADGQLVLLENDRQVSAAEADQWLETGPRFEVAAPFGEERVYVFAQTAAFPPLSTQKDAGGFLFITDKLPAALEKTRKLKRRQLFAEDDVMFKKHP